MSKTVHEIRMEKLRDWEIQEESNRRESKKAWWRCGISLGALLLSYPLFKWNLGETLECLLIIFFAVCGFVFLFSVGIILQLEKEQKALQAKWDLLTELDRRDV